MSPGTVQFVGLSGYAYPHTRVRCYRFAEALATHGYRTRVFSFHDRLAPDLPEPLMYGLSDAQRLALVVKATLRLARRPGSLLYLQKIHYHAAAVLLLHRFGVPYVLDYDDWEVGHDPYGVPLFCGFKHPRLNREVFGSCDPEMILARVARAARFVVCASRFLVDRLGEFADRLAYIPTGVDTSRFTPVRLPHEGTVVLWNGVVWGEMIRDNVMILLRAFQTLAPEFPEARVCIVGEGPYLHEVRRAARDLGIDGRVRWAGWRHPDEMPGELARADVGVMPVAHDDEWTRGKSPTKLFEYMAAGLPVVVMRNGEAGHVVEHERSGFVVADERGFTECLRRLLEDDDLRRRMGARARQAAEERYSMTVLGETLSRQVATWWRAGTRGGQG